MYGWAGQFRRIRIGKDGSAFRYPENISREMKELFAWLRQSHFLNELDLDGFCIRGAHFLATLNAIHPFREGNGRTQTAFMALLCDQAGYPLDLELLEPDSLLSAMIRSRP